MTRHIEVKISPTVSEHQRRDPRFIKLLKDAEGFFNCSKPCCFSSKCQQLLSLHEGAHAFFAKKAGASDIEFHGPQMMWDYRPKYGYDCPAISRASTVWTLDTDSAIDYVKASVAGYVCRREMSDTPNDSVAITLDIDFARDWYQKRVGGTEAEFQKVIVEAERSILQDLKDPAVQAGVLAEAYRFQNEIFSRRKLTSAVLRARRLGWA
jgi:hypothetical protein